MTKKLTDIEKVEIKKKLESGMIRREIAEIHGINESHLSRMARKWGLQKKDVRKELINQGKVDNAVENAATQELIRENKERLELILQTGKFCVDEFGARAKNQGYTNIRDFLSMAVDFWITSHQEIDELREDLTLSHSTMEFLMVQIDPELVRIERENKLSNLAMLQLMKEGKIQEDLLQAYLDL